MPIYPQRLVSYATGWARSAAESEAPEHWDGLMFSLAPLGVTGALWRDVSGHGHVATLTTMDPATDWVPTPYGYGLDFDGINDYLVWPFIYTVTDITVIIWTFFVSAGGGANKHALDLFDTPAVGDDRIVARFGFPDWFLRDSGGTSLQPSLTPVNDDWAMYAVSLKGTVATSYLNGVQEGQDSDAGWTSMTFQQGYIGREAVLADAGKYAGRVAIAKVYFRALNSAEMLDQHERPLAWITPRPLQIVAAPVAPSGGPFPHYTRRRMTGGMISMGAA